MNGSLAGLTQYIPLAIVIVVSFMLVKGGHVKLHLMLLALLLGVLLAGSPVGPVINEKLALYSGGYL